MNNILLCFPRSGSTYLLVALEMLTGRTCESYGRVNFSELLSDTSNPIIERIHLLNDIDQDKVNKCKKLTLLLRNPIECLKSHQARDNGKLQTDLYMNILAAYDSYQGDKCIIYYEDLVLAPVQPLLTLADHLQISWPQKSRDEFTELFEAMKQRGKTIYQKQTEILSNGDLKHFQRSEDSKVTNEIIKELSSKNQELFDKYIKDKYV